MKQNLILIICLSMLIVGCAKEPELPTMPELPSEPEMEQKPCTADYKPVCGADGVTYGNKCMAGNVEIVSEGECPLEAHVCTEEEKSNQKCTREYMPVCGNDGKTYPTGCVACSEGIDSYVPGECSAEVHVCTEEEKQAEICTMDYVPVCGNDGKTYGNACSACSAKIESWTAGEC